MNAPLSLDEARRRIAATVVPIGDIEQVPLAAALGRVLAVDVVARSAVPPHDNSAMDGYALRAGEAVHPRVLRIVGESRAGAPFVGRCGPDECIRILTGAVIPADCDAVVAQERVAVAGGTVRIDVAVPSGQHIRRAGEDLAIGGVVLSARRHLTASDLGIAASIGQGSLAVKRRPRVAVFSTGDELRDIDDTLPAGCVRDANRYTIVAMLAGLGIDAIDLGIVRDDREALDATLTRALAVDADAIITSGGVSAGDADYIRDVVARRGEVAFWTLAVKPGRPMAFGAVSNGDRPALLFGLPGNPVAVMVIFHALVRDALFALMGADTAPPLLVDAICDSVVGKVAGRTEFVRAVATQAAGGLHVRPTADQGAGILRSMSEANCLVVLEHDRGPVGVGDRVGIWLFDGLA